MKIAPGKIYEIAYKLYRVNPDGTEDLVHESEKDEPDRIICGASFGVIEALEENLLGKEAGDKFDFIAEPEKAFGPYSEEEIYTVPRENMTVDGKFREEMFTPGALIPMMTPDGFRIDGVVVELTPEAVVIDLNHPLAKNNVHYVGEVLTVREPTPEELQPKSCGGGCGGGCCGSEGDNGGCCGGGCC
ncbi:MAG: peptidylprolyl isomerase [Bacteroidales bacterium]|nr:peptidylprolyl isomerase [Bacteroidales bacterium]